MKNILVTGGAGYIGSHTCVELIKNGYHPIVFDNLSNGSIESLHRVGEITGVMPGFYKGDVRNLQAVADIFMRKDIDAVIHFAGLKSVGESFEKPVIYYDNNVAGTINLLGVMEDFEVHNLVFSSSATVYTNVSDNLPLTENAPLGAINPYGRSKLMVEEILRDLAQTNPKLALTSLRYFNPVGAHFSGLIGEDPTGIPNNIAPYITQVMTGRRHHVNVFGNDYPTPDGTGVRDYIHVVDLAKGHIAALNHLFDGNTGSHAFNLGTGYGTSVLELINAFSRVGNMDIRINMTERRPGDLAECYADPSLAQEILGWRAEKDLGQMCSDAWLWQYKNPNGYLN